MNILQRSDPQTFMTMDMALLTTISSIRMRLIVVIG